MSEKQYNISVRMICKNCGRTIFYACKDEIPAFFMLGDHYKQIEEKQTKIKTTDENRSCLFYEVNPCPWCIKKSYIETKAISLQMQIVDALNEFWEQEKQEFVAFILI